MHTLAKNLGLPTSFVEIRHAATHEALPGLALLRTATIRALDWLWENYWLGVGVGEPELAQDEGGEEEEEVVGKAKAKTLLKSFRSLRRAEPARAIKSGDGREDTKLVLALIKECVSIAGAGLIEALLEEKALIPSGKHKSPLMKGAILLWKPLLDALDAGVPGFADSLLSAMLERLKHVRGEVAEVLVAWVMHLTSNAKSGFGRNPDAPVDWDGLAKQCVLYPSEWTMRLLKHLLKERAALRGRYAGLVEMAEAQVVLSRDLGVEIEGRMKKEKRTSKASDEEESPQLTGKKRTIHDVEEEVKMFEARYEAMKKMRLSRNSESTTITSIPEGRKEVVEEEGEVVIGRWKKWSGKWAPRPIGVI
ncbi:Las1-domain-containing protein [Choiromyces venosus 120613-1]|uniref:Las1-domain-containing protein n=1 Tax=Choiromyces venosus 120613-1 TaxID=1336337 RepID=A0A3N4JEU6_9PEZI|nr:Las1-domain-containing protein [Choiromyces venosus 120613-1]